MLFGLGIFRLKNDCLTFNFNVMLREKLLSKYVPRHFRLGICSAPVDCPSRHEVVERVPVVDNGSVVYTVPVVKVVDAIENMAKFKLDHFRLSAMVKNGVPLEMINVNHSSTFNIEQLNTIASSLDNAEKFVQNFEAQQEERKSWFKFDSEE